MDRAFFDRGSPYLDHPLLTAHRSAAELDRIEELIGPIAGPVVDVGCGFGRHVVELARRGIRAYGLDPSPAMIDGAEARAAELGVAIDVEVGDAETLRAGGRRSGFALALCLFTTLGQRDPLEPIDPSDAPERRTLGSIAAALSPGAALVVEVPNRSELADTLVEEETIGPMVVHRHLDRATGVVHERFQLESGDRFLLAYRVFDRTELRGMLVDAGFELEHELDGALAPPPPGFMTAIARKSA